MPIKRLYKSERFLRIIFGASLFVVLCMGGLAYKYISTLSDSFKMVEHTYEVHIELQKTWSILKNAENGQRGFLISNDSSFLEAYDSRRVELDRSLSRLNALIVDDPTQKANLKELETKIDNRLVFLEKALELTQNNEAEHDNFITTLKLGREAMNSIRFEVNEMIEHENILLKERKKNSSESLSDAPLLVYYVLILALGLLLLIYAKMSKNLKILGDNNERLQLFKESTAQSEIVSKHCTWEWHIDANYYEFSDNLYSMLGVTPQSFDATIANFMSFVHPEDADNLNAQVALMVENENLPFVNYRIIQPSGEIKHFKGYAKVIINTLGDRILLGTIADVSEEVESYRLVEERNLELERNNKELESFNYVASHDLQEPLRKIQTFTSRLEDLEYERLSDNGKVYIERIKLASGRMRNLIDDLLQFSRTNRSEELLELSNMNALLNTAKQELVEIIHEKEAKIFADALPQMTVIPFQMKQLFQNLMNNSLKYSKENIAPVINVTYSKTKTQDIPEINTVKYSIYHTITITDNGIGFNQEYADKVFILFNRLHGKNEYSGTGIGLSICKKIVENHEGYIFAKGVPNVGATFIIYLPLA